MREHTRIAPEIPSDRLVPAEAHDAVIAAARDVADWIELFYSPSWDGMDAHAGLRRSGAELSEALDRYQSVQGVRDAA